MRITRINTFMAAEGMGDQLRSALLTITPLLQTADGCASCRVVRNLERPDELLLVERWTSAAAQAASAPACPPPITMTRKCSTARILPGDVPDSWREGNYPVCLAVPLYSEHPPGRSVLDRGL